jgi:hypothetical protein
LKTKETELSSRLAISTGISSRRKLTPLARAARISLPSLSLPTARIIPMKEAYGTESATMAGMAYKIRRKVSNTDTCSASRSRAITRI